MHWACDGKIVEKISGRIRNLGETKKLVWDIENFKLRKYSYSI